MNRAQVGTIIFVVAGIVYVVLMYRFLVRKKITDFYTGWKTMTPGILVIILLYAWLALDLSLLEIIVSTLISIAVFAVTGLMWKAFIDMLKKPLGK